MEGCRGEEESRGEKRFSFLFSFFFLVGRGRGYRGGPVAQGVGWFEGVWGERGGGLITLQRKMLGAAGEPF